MKFLIPIALLLITACKGELPCPPKECPPLKPCPPEKICPPEKPCPECPPKTQTQVVTPVAKLHLSAKVGFEKDLVKFYNATLGALSAPVKAVPTLINGTVADPKKFTGVVWIGNCTATVIGPQTLITAAHCTRSKVSFSVGGSKYQGQCMYSSEYNGNATADYSICFISSPVQGIEFETINTDPGFIAVDDKILQSGFGCTKWGKQLDGKFRTGISSVLKTPSGKDYDYRTGRGEDGEAVLCSGDSGGPAWGLDASGERTKLISVNSRSNTTTRSYLSALATPAFTKLLASFQDKHKTSVCGVDGFDVGCRGAIPLPKYFAIQSGKAYMAGFIEREHASKHEKIIEALSKAIE